MAIVRIPDENRSLNDPEAITAHLASIGIEYERWEPDHAGDLIRVPRGTWHWFDLCADRRIRAIRLFQDPVGWTPHYTDSGVDRNYQPLCLGPSYFPSWSAHS